jgi:hypothetical protein
MPAAYVPLIIDQGEDWTTQLVWTGDDDEPQQIIAPCRLDIKDNLGATHLTLTTPEVALAEGEIPEISISSEIGLVQLHIEDSATAAPPAGQYQYDLFVTVSDNDVYAGTQVHRLLYGPVTVNKRVTQM